VQAAHRLSASTLWYSISGPQVKLGFSRIAPSAHLSMAMSDETHFEGSKQAWFSPEVVAHACPSGLNQVCYAVESWLNSFKDTANISTGLGLTQNLSVTSWGHTCNELSH
jgi:hypothetical protein